jgi:hypothetical protein
MRPSPAGVWVISSVIAVSLNQYITFPESVWPLIPPTVKEFGYAPMRKMVLVIF